MSLAAWVALVVVGAAAVRFVFWAYARREVAVRGRGWLALVRGTLLLLLLTLIFNPSVPGRATGSSDPAPWVALDASLSMSAGGVDGTAWDRAVARARELGGSGARVAIFGGEGPADGNVLDGPPTGLDSRLDGLLRRAMESGAREVTVLSDLRLSDPVAVRATLARNEIAVHFEDVGRSPRNAGVARFELPSAVGADEPVSGEVVVHASAAAAGTMAILDVRQEDRLVDSRELELPAPGRTTRIQLTLPAVEVSGEVRYEVRITLEADGFGDDDAAVAYTDVDPEEGLLVAVALDPDWEFRFLLPVLEQVTGLSSRGYVRIGPELYSPSGAAVAVATVDHESVRRQVETAEILVVQGPWGREQQWLSDAVESAPRLVVLAPDRQDVAAMGLSVAPRRSGEWYVDPEVPPSSLAGELTAALWQGLPPLLSILPLAPEARTDTPLLARLRGGSAPEAVIALSASGRLRRVVALGSGFWRWAFRPGVPREAYRRLWSAVAGWLLSDEAAPAGGFIRPVDRVVPRGGPVGWAAPGLAGARVMLTLESQADAALDTVVVVPQSGIFSTPPVPSGTYEYSAVAEGEQTGSRGRFDVEARTAELERLPAWDLLAAIPVPPLDRRSRASRPLRTHPAPYLVLLALLSGEWIARRRRGLR